MNRQNPGIEWCHYTWNPVTGCLHGCEYCYVPRVKGRFMDNPMQPAFHENRLREPLSVRRPSRIFVCSTGDLFGSWVSARWIRQVLDICAAAGWHRFLLLTKNPARYVEFEIPPNCWCGTSITGGGGADNVLMETRRIGAFYKSAPLDRMFISLEPFVNFDPGLVSSLVRGMIIPADWLIVGGLTGQGARPCNPHDLRDILERRRESRKPVFIKSNAGYPWPVQQYPPDLRLE